MTSANKHMARSHRSYSEMESTIGNFQRKNIVKQSKAGKSKVPPILERLKANIARLFNFKPQNKG